MADNHEVHPSLVKSPSTTFKARIDQYHVSELPLDSRDSIFASMNDLDNFVIDIEKEITS